MVKLSSQKATVADFPVAFFEPTNIKPQVALIVINLFCIKRDSIGLSFTSSSSSGCSTRS